MHFVSVLKRKADFELDFELFNTRISFLSLNLTELVGKNGWKSGNTVARREIPEGEPECFTGNSEWLFVLNYQKLWLIQRARGRFATQVNKLSLT